MYCFFLPHMERLHLLFLFLLFSHQTLPLPLNPPPPHQQQESVINDCNSPTSTSPDFQCKPDERGAQCATFAVLRTNSYYSSLSNLSLYLGLTPAAVADATGFSSTTQFLPIDQPLLLPIDCRCDSPSGFFRAELVRTTARGDSVLSVSESLEGLTTCKAVVEKNPSTRILPFPDLGAGVRITVPIKCGCPSKPELSSGTNLVISYPVRAGETISSLASYFKVSKEAIISTNNGRLAAKDYHKEPGTDLLVPYSLVLIPVNQKPALGSLAGPREPNLGAPGVRPVAHLKKKKKKKGKAMIAVVTVVVAATAAIAVAAVLVTLQRKKNESNNDEIRTKNKQSSITKLENGEPYQFNLSIRTTSEKKLSFEGSQSTIDGQLTDVTPHKTLESYTLEEINRATEDFDSHNLVEGSLYHGRIRGKDVAIKCTATESFPKVDFTLFQDSMHHHPNILRLYGACFSETTSQSFLVFEYAKNGSLKDWIHGGLAVKSHFISSCSCFLNWSQRLGVCLDVATALQYMHHIMSPGYVHRSIKSRNIFLDDEFHAKIGNFGMARCVEDDFPLHYQFSETWNSWDKAYMAPELRKRGTINPSVDIFAYGVVVLEVLSGKKPVMYSEEKGKEEGGGVVVMLAEKIRGVLGSESESELRGWMDSTLGENYSFEGAVTVAKLAKACVEDDPRLRPSAGEIVEKLSGLVEGAVVVGGGGELENEGSSKPLVKAADWSINTDAV